MLTCYFYLYVRVDLCMDKKLVEFFFVKCLMWMEEKEREEIRKNYIFKIFIYILSYFKIFICLLIYRMILKNYLIRYTKKRRRSVSELFF